jgi:sigma-B regulation protein RsbU (phosphoserine phosphatase)
MSQQTLTGKQPDHANRPAGLGSEAPWQKQLSNVVEMMRDISRQTDPQKVVEIYAARTRPSSELARFIAISRRNVEAPKFKITRNSDWPVTIDPWKSPHLLPILEGGLLGKLLYDEQAFVIQDLQVDPSDPAAEYLAGMRSLLAIPNFDRGTALNMVIMMKREPNGFPVDAIPEQVLMSNLFGRATQTLVLSRQVKEAYDAVDKELQVVADIQRSLLPEWLPEIPTLELAAYYQTSKRAGGDYYDFFPVTGANGEPALSERGRWGILIADVSGHGTPAAVLMAVTHSIAHTCCQEPTSPGELLRFVNEHLCARYTNGTGTFVTAFYGIYDPVTRELQYASAGHCPPRLLRDGKILSLEAARYLPLGIERDEPYGDGIQKLEPGDVLVLYTDGITEARRPGIVTELLGIPRLDEAIIDAVGSAQDYVRATLDAVDHFEGGFPAADDKTLLVAKVK